MVSCCPWAWSRGRGPCLPQQLALGSPPPRGRYPPPRGNCRHRPERPRIEIPGPSFQTPGTRQTRVSALPRPLVRRSHLHLPAASPPNPGVCREPEPRAPPTPGLPVRFPPRLVPRCVPTFTPLTRGLSPRRPQKAHLTVLLAASCTGHLPQVPSGGVPSAQHPDSSAGSGGHGHTGTPPSQTLLRHERCPRPEPGPLCHPAQVEGLPCTLDIAGRARGTSWEPPGRSANPSPALPRACAVSTRTPRSDTVGAAHL